MIRAAVLLSVIPLAVSGLIVQAQTQTASDVPTKDATAVNLAINALKGMTGGVALNDVTLTGQVVRAVAADSDSGPAILQASNAGAASFTFSLGSGQRAEVINPASTPQAAWLGEDGTWHRTAIHNTWTPAAWFAPALVLEAVLGDQQLAVETLDATSLGGEVVQHLRCWRVLPSYSGSPGDLALIQRFSTVDIYLDATSNLPVELYFDLHPDSNASMNIPVEIRYSDWRISSGVLVPYRIQRFFNGGLLDDISVSSATLNSGLSSLSFNVPATSGDAE